MKHFIAIVFTYVILPLTNAQSIPCDYVPLEFDSITPLWSHLCIDSSIVGYVDTCADWVENYYDGMDQLSFQKGSFLTDDHLYSITINQYDIDDAGYLLEKINLSTGELEWNTVTDLRSSDYRQQIVYGEEKEGKLHVYGRRFPTKDMKGDAPLRFGASFNGVHFHKVYDADTGVLIHHYTPEESDTLAFEMLFDNPRIDRFYMDDHQDYFIFANNLITDHRTQSLIRWKVDSLGHLISGPDTVVSGFMNGIPNGSAFSTSTPSLEKTNDNTFLFLDQFSPRDSSQYDFMATLTEYDEDFNRLNSVDLTKYLPSEFYLLFLFGDFDNRVSGITDEHIFINCSYRSLRNYSQYFTIILDREFNLISKYDLSYNGDFVGVRSHPQYGGKVYYGGSNFVENGNSEMYIYEGNDRRDLSKVHTFTITEPDWVSFIEKIFVLDNGDFLIRMTHSCYVDGQKNSWHPEWKRFAREDILNMVDVTEVPQEELMVTLSPNPVINNLMVELVTPLSGTVSIMDLSGNLVQRKIIKASRQINLDVSILPAGTYFLMINDNNGAVIREHFVKLN